MKIYMIGTGMEGDRTLTREASDAITEAELLIGAERMLRPFQHSGKEMLCTYKTEEIAARLTSGTERCAAVLLSGDCGFFSGAKKLLPLLKDEDVRIISGISAPVYFAAKLGIPWEQMQFISLHGEENNIAVHVRQHRYCCFLLGGKITAAMLCHRLCEYKLWDTTVYIGENLGYEKEHIFTEKPLRLLSHPEESLTVVITENPAACEYLPSGIPDADFFQTNVPITKAEVRCNVVSALQIRRQDICWDIGCGTGSVSVEMALRCPEGKVFAIDKNGEAIRLTKENHCRFACDNIDLYYGSAPEDCADFPAPDKVFIGGSSGRIPDILAMIYSKNPAAQIVITAVSLETLSEAVRAFDAYHTECEVTQIAVTRTRKVGSHTMLQAQNPIFIIKGVLQ